MKSLTYTLSDDEKERIGRDMYQFITELYPLCRSISGDGVRQTHALIGKHIPIATRDVPTGTKVLDWTVPREWNIKDAYVINRAGRKIIDFKASNLHVLNYSIPVRARMTLEELKPHLHTLPEYPGVIPYLTTYYHEDWGFCLTYDQFLKLKPGEYEVVIDSSLENGSLTYSEYYLKGEKPDEILISCYTCHPSLCNDNLSGIALVTFLAKQLKDMSLRYSYRFLFIPETIGAITWLALNEDRVASVKYGLVVTCVGDRGRSTYQKTRQGDTELDKAVVNVLRNSGDDYAVRGFLPYGSDERQFSSPGFNLPVGSLMRTPYLSFPEYHTSADNLDFVQADSLANSLTKYLSVLYVVENNRTYLNLNPKGEPQFSKRGLHKTVGGQRGYGKEFHALFWLLNLSDGHNSLLSVSDRSGTRFDIIKQAAEVLVEHKLLREI